MIPPIVLIHGLFGSLRDAKIMTAFGSADVLAPDLIGYGINRDDAPNSWTLEDQADHLATLLRGRVGHRAHLVGHSVGGAVAVLFARRYPEMTASLTSVEGNFTLADAFWSQKIAQRTISEVKAEIDGFRADVQGWLARSGVTPTPWTLAVAQEMLDNQPAATIRSQARAVVAATGAATYLDEVRGCLASGTPFHLVAGERSRAEWSVPDWVEHGATSSSTIGGTGHLMMLEAPDLFASTVMCNLDQSELAVSGNQSGS